MFTSKALLIVFLLVLANGCKKLSYFKGSLTSVKVPAGFCSGERLTNSPYAGGSGSYEDPYLICNSSQLLALAGNPSDYNLTFALAGDIDLEGINFPGIGSFLQPFQGTFMGNQHTIRGLTMTGSGNYVALFPVTERAHISGFTLHEPEVLSAAFESVSPLIGMCLSSTLMNVNVVGARVSGREYVGLAAGYSDDCVMYNLDLEGDITLDSSYGGGIWGLVERSRALNVQVRVNISGPMAQNLGGIAGAESFNPTYVQYVSASGSVSGEEAIGGFVGYNMDGVHIFRSRFQGALSGSRNIGGMIGLGGDSPLNVYSSSVDAMIEGEEAVGGFVGRHAYTSNFYDSFVTGSITGTGPAQDGIGGFFGVADYYGDIYRSYSAMTIDSTGVSVGGAIGKVNYWSSSYGIRNSFFAGTVEGRSASNSISLFLGQNSSNPLLLTNAYYWSGGTCLNSGAGNCNTTFGTGNASLSFFYNEANLPLSIWDMTEVWEPSSTSFPTLQNVSFYTPTYTHNCGTSASEGAAFLCVFNINDSDSNETTFLVVQEDHTCKWLQPTRGDRLSGTPGAQDVGTCQVSFIVTDGMNSSAVERYMMTVSP